MPRQTVDLFSPYGVAQTHDDDECFTGYGIETEIDMLLNEKKRKREMIRRKTLSKLKDQTDADRIQERPRSNQGKYH